jgi:hypothetical protein
VASSARRRRNRGQTRIAVVSLASLFALSSVVAGQANPVRSDASPQTRKNESAQQLVRDVVWNEIHAQTNDPTFWHYREVQEDHGPRRLLDVIQTRDGQIYRVLAIHGQPLRGKQLETEDNRIEKLLHDPEQVQENQKKREQDANQERTLLNVLPNAFIFREEGRQGSNIKLAFTPNPSFHPATHAAEVFHHMEGTMLIDGNAKRLVEIDGRLTSKVKFAGGLLGHLDEGGTFRVQQRNVGAGHWDTVLIDVQMNGKALFFKTIAVRQKEVYSDYREVPGTVTLQQAGQQLRKEANTAAAAGKEPYPAAARLGVMRSLAAIQGKIALCSPAQCTATCHS